MLHIRRLSFLGFILLLAGCAPFVKQQQDDSFTEQLWDLRYQQLQSLEQWGFRGRVALTQGNEAWQAGLHWQRQVEQFDIRILGPFSQGGVSLVGDESQVVLTMSDGQTLVSNSPEDLLEEALGWNLPVSILADWVRGIPAKQMSIEKKILDDVGRLSYLEQAGWQVEFLRYVTVDGIDLPGKIFMDSPALNIRLVISDWDI